eukprot:479688-Pleurochrysis_carterae.AAC.8
MNVSRPGWQCVGEAAARTCELGICYKEALLQAFCAACPPLPLPPPSPPPSPPPPPPPTPTSPVCRTVRRICDQKIISLC